MLRSVKNWLTLLFLAVVALAVLLIYAYVVPNLEDRLVNQKLRLIEANSTLVTENVLQAIKPGPSGDLLYNRATLSTQASLLAGRIDARIIVIAAANGQKLADSSSAELDIRDYPMATHAEETGSIEVGTATTASGAQYAAAAVPVPFPNEPGRVAVVVLIASSLNDVHTAVAAVERQILLASGLALVATIVIGYLASYFIARRLKRVERSAEAIAAGDFSAPVPAGVGDEIGQLGFAFNVMGVRLREAFSQIEREKENVEILLNDLIEGVIGVTADGRVAIANPAAAALLDAPLPPGAELAKVVPDDVLRAFADSRDAGEDHTVVFIHEGFTLQASVYAVKRVAEVDTIIVLRDVTEQAKLDQARREFIATASHELKTPLFSLSGFMELLDEGDLDADTQREFLSLMRQQVDRLTDLSLSLLDLSQVDSGAVHLETADVDVRAIAEVVAAEFRPAAAAREIAIAVTGPGDLCARGDERRLAQVLRALVDNAVRYSPSGGEVGVDIEGRRKTVSLTVRDQGPGVPASELPRIFERFFRGAADHGPKTGTGLGLSIAKDLVELMGGTLTVRSQRGAGARFSVQLPRAALQRAPAPHG